MGQVDHPCGTLEELQEQGLDPRKVACCAPNSPGVRGCNHYEDCIFHMKRYGGFRGKGPRYVGYFLKTHEGAKKEDFMSCYHFIKTLLGRMRAGNAYREQGKPHEVIRIIAQEGEPVLKRFDEALDKNNNKTGDLRRKIYHRSVAVPPFPRPKDNPLVTYDQELDARELERDRIANPDDFERLGAPAEGFVVEPGPNLAEPVEQVAKAK
jgi:hypothetical protein